MLIVMMMMMLVARDCDVCLVWTLAEERKLYLTPAPPHPCSLPPYPHTSFPPLLLPLLLHHHPKKTKCYHLDPGRLLLLLLLRRNHPSLGLATLLVERTRDPIFSLHVLAHYLLLVPFLLLLTVARPRLCVVLALA